MPHYYLGVAYINTGNFDAAIKHGEMAAKRNPGFIQAYQLMAHAYRQQGNYQAAEAYEAHAKKIQAATQR